MAKRFTDSEKFRDVWYRKLSPIHKLFWEYLLAECNHAGIVELDIEQASFLIGDTITQNDVEMFIANDKIIHIEKYLYFIPNFIKFQYGELNPQSKVHASVIKELKRYPIDTLSIGLGKSMDTIKDKDKDKDKVKDKNKDNIVINCYGENYEVFMTESDYQKLLALTQSKEMLNNVINDFEVNIRVGKEQPYKAELPHAHYERLKAYINHRRTHPEQGKEQKSKYKTAQERKQAEIERVIGGKNG